MYFRKADLKDIPEIVQINIKNWQETYKGLLSEQFLNSLDEDKLAKEWKDSIENCLVAVKESTIAGYGVSSKDKEIPECIYIDTLQVKKEERHKGIGSSLLKWLLNNAFENGYKKASICIVRGNQSARNLYTRIGFRHLCYFTDDFHGTTSQSEKLILDKEDYDVQRDDSQKTGD